MAAPVTVAWVQSTPFGDLGVLSSGPDGVERILPCPAPISTTLCAPPTPGTARFRHGGRHGGVAPPARRVLRRGTGSSSTSPSTSPRDRAVGPPAPGPRDGAGRGALRRDRDLRRARGDGGPAGCGPGRGHRDRRGTRCRSSSRATASSQPEGIGGYGGGAQGVALKPGCWIWKLAVGPAGDDVDEAARQLELRRVAAVGQLHVAPFLASFARPRGERDGHQPVVPPCSTSVGARTASRSAASPT